MRHRLSLISPWALALLILACPAFGQLRTPIRENGWNDSYGAVTRFARYTGRPVLVLFSEEWCGHCEDLQKIVEHPDVRKAARRFLLLKISFDKDPGLAKRLDVESHHRIVVLDWSGKTVARAGEDRNPKAVALTVIEAAASSDLSAGRKLFELGHFAKAAERFRLVLKITRDKATATTAQEEIEKVRLRSEREIKRIMDFVRAGKPGEAADACKTFIDRYPEDMGRAKVEKLLTRLKAGVRIDLPDDKPAGVRTDEPTAADELRAARLLDKGMVYEWDKLFYDASAAYEKILKDYPRTASAKKAKTRLDAFNADPRMKDRIAQMKMDKFCKRWLEMGKLYEKNDRDDLAEKYYNTIVKVYPKSPYADWARHLLANIEKRQKKK